MAHFTQLWKSHCLVSVALPVCKGDDITEDPSDWSMQVTIISEISDDDSVSVRLMLILKQQQLLFVHSCIIPTTPTWQCCTRLAPISVRSGTH